MVGYNMVCEFDLNSNSIDIYQIVYILIFVYLCIIYLMYNLFNINFVTITVQRTENCIVD